MIQSGQVSNSDIWEFIHVHLICKFQEDLNQTEQTGFFSNQGDVTLKTRDPIWPSFKHPRFHPCPPYPQVSGRSKTDQVMLMIMSNSGIFSNQRNDTLRQIIPIWPGFEIIRDCIHVHLICKFKEDPIKTEQVMLMTKSNSFFSAIKGT